MTVIVDIDKVKLPTPEKIERSKSRIGKLLMRMRKGTIRRDGRALSYRDVAEISDLSPMTVSNAEKGKFTVETFLKLFSIYRGKLDVVAFADLLQADDMDNSFVPLDVLRAFAEGIDLSATEFLRIVTHFPDISLKVTYRAYIELASLGFATRFEDRKGKSTLYYATTVEYAKQSGEDWSMAGTLLATPFAQCDDKQQEFYSWAQQTLIKAMSEHPEYKAILGTEDDD